MDYLLKTEPSVYSFADLQRDKTTTWDGVTNPVAVKNLRGMKSGDRNSGTDGSEPIFSSQSRKSSRQGNPILAQCRTPSLQKPQRSATRRFW